MYFDDIMATSDKFGLLARSIKITYILYHNMTSPPNITIRTAFIMTLAVLSTSITINYQKSVNSETFRTSFKLAYTAAGSSLTVIVKPQEQGATYNILLWRPGQSSPSSMPFQQAGPFTDTQLFVSNILDTSGSWRV